MIVDFNIAQPVFMTAEDFNPRIPHSGGRGFKSFDTFVFGFELLGTLRSWGFEQLSRLDVSWILMHGGMNVISKNNFFGFLLEKKGFSIFMAFSMAFILMAVVAGIWRSPEFLALFFFMCALYFLFVMCLQFAEAYVMLLKAYENGWRMDALDVMHASMCVLCAFLCSIGAGFSVFEVFEYLGVL